MSQTIGIEIENVFINKDFSLLPSVKFTLNVRKAVRYYDGNLLSSKYFFFTSYLMGIR